MSGTAVEIKTPDGTARARIFKPEGGGPFPGVLFCMDALGSRPALWAMAERLAQHGYFVLLPDLFYRNGTELTFDPKTVFSDEAQRGRLMSFVEASSAREPMIRDATAYLEFLSAQKAVALGPVGVAGYCMGGFWAFSLAGLFPDRIAAAGSFHGGRLATDAPNSPHLLADKVKGQLYFGHADQDNSMNQEAILTLEAALSKAGVTYTSEIYPGAGHGYAVEDMPVFEKTAAERHWTALFALLDKTLHHNK